MDVLIFLHVKTCIYRKKKCNFAAKDVYWYEVDLLFTQTTRFAKNPLIHCNAQMTSKMIRQYCVIDEECDSLMRMVMTKMGLSARAYDRILKAARTIADLSGAENIRKQHLMEAISYRSLDRSNWGG